MLRRQLPTAAGMVLVFTVLTGMAYPLLVTGIGQVAFHGRAEGSLIERDGQLVGSRLIGQSFTRPEYFHPRPSAAGDGYDATASAATNLGPTNPDLRAVMEQRAVTYRQDNGLAPDAPVPGDALTTSASGLDPHISVDNALAQAPRVAEARRLALDVVVGMIDDHTDRRGLGFLGENAVNVLELNLALDEARQRQ